MIRAEIYVPLYQYFELLNMEECLSESVRVGLGIHVGQWASMHRVVLKQSAGSTCAHSVGTTIERSESSRCFWLSSVKTIQAMSERVV
jgi:hypothetical protein